MRRILFIFITLFCFTSFAKPHKQENLINVFEKIKNIPVLELENFLASKIPNLTDIKHFQNSDNISDMCTYKSNIEFRIEHFYYLFNKEKRKIIAGKPNKIGISNYTNDPNWHKLHSLIINLELFNQQFAIKMLKKGVKDHFCNLF